MTVIITSTIDNTDNARVAPSVTLYAVKILNYVDIGTYSNVAEGIILAVRGPNGMERIDDDMIIFNMTLGRNFDGKALGEAVRWACKRGVIIVAAGN